MSPVTAPAATAEGRPRTDPNRCRLCSVILGLDDDRANRLCLDCLTRPEAKRVLGSGRQAATAPSAPKPAGAPPAPPQPRPFTAAEKSLIKHTGSYMPASDLLQILNDRMHADLGAEAPDYTLEQLQAEIQGNQQEQRSADWAGVRQVIAVARRCGVLAEVTPQVIDDFAVVYQLSGAQKTHLRDVVRSAKEAS